MSELSGTTGADGIGRRLAAHRARRGLRVAELARQVGVTPSLISQIERGQSRPSVSTLFALAQTLGVPVDAFFRESPEPVLPPEPRLPPDAGIQPAPGLPSEPGLPTGVSSEAGVVPESDLSSEPGSREPREPASEAPEPAAGRYLVRKRDRAAIDIEGGVRWERLTRNTMDHLDFFELIYAPGAESHPRQYTHPGTEMVLVMKGRMEITVGFERYRLGPGDSIDFPSTMPHRYVNHGDETAHAVTVIFYDCPGTREEGRPAP